MHDTIIFLTFFVAFCIFIFSRCPTTCTDEVLRRMATDGAGSFMCRDRIQWIISNLEYTETQACLRVSHEFPDICGSGCNPESCY